jgi:hypothetical protein
MRPNSTAEPACYDPPVPTDGRPKRVGARQGTGPLAYPHGPCGLARLPLAIRIPAFAGIDVTDIGLIEWLVVGLICRRPATSA